jgi:hypothetical protein
MIAKVALVKGGVSMGMNILPDMVRSLDKDPQTYSYADPSPHIAVDNFLPQSAVDTLVDEIPDPRNSIWNERIKDPLRSSWRPTMSIPPRRTSEMFSIG